MTERERILEKIKRVRALAERGVDGEKDSATALLDRMMEKYGITETELAEERREIAWFRYKTPLECRLLHQVIYAVTGRAASGCVGAYTGRKRKKVGIECTASLLKRNLNGFILRSCKKNRIFPDNPIDDAREIGEMSLEEAQRISMMMAGMDEHTRRKMLESGAGT